MKIQVKQDKRLMFEKGTHPLLVRREAFINIKAETTLLIIYINYFKEPIPARQKDLTSSPNREASEAFNKLN